MAILTFKENQALNILKMPLVWSQQLLVVLTVVVRLLLFGFRMC